MIGDSDARLVSIAYCKSHRCVVLSSCRNASFGVGGQLELAELLGGRALKYLSDVAWATEDEKRTARALQVECYQELARAKNLLASEDRAVSARHEILAEALESCGKALAIE